MDHYAKAYPIFSRIRGLEEVKKMLRSLRRFSKDEVANERLKILEFYTEYGEKATTKAFGIKRNTIFVWRRRLKESKNSLASLIPTSTTPKTQRRMITDPKIVSEIRKLREKYPRLGKDKIKPILKKYCLKEGLTPISISTIGKVIKRRNLTFEKKVYPQKQPNKFKKLRTRKSPKVQSPGFIEMDSIIAYINYEKHLFMSVIDIYTKFALVVYVKDLSSATAKKVLQQFQELNPTKIHTVQTDNGSEFLRSFHAYLEEQHIKHQFIYPRMPKINSFIERFNRTIQEEFILRSDEIYYDQEAFAKKLTKYLYWYNYQRPHASLKYMSPMDYFRKVCDLYNN